MASDFFSDAGQAEAACREALADRFIHVHGIGWFRYTGKVWAEVPVEIVVAHVANWTGERLERASRAKPFDPELVKAWVKRREYPRLKAVVALAAGREGVSKEPDQLDSNPDLLNVQNGAVYLPTGDLIPHDPRHYCTRIAGADFDPTALHEDWTAALAAVPPEVQPWLQTRYGQALTGYPPSDDRIVIQHGGGGNGKSTVIDAIARALGDYYHLAPASLLMRTTDTGATPDLADLRGRRFVSVEETPEAGRLNVQLLKGLVGTPRITARKLYRDHISFPASHSLFLNTNYEPSVGETDKGTWRRLFLVRFPYDFDAPIDDPEGISRKPDRGLRARLGVEASPDRRAAVLAWLIEGAARWYEGHDGARRSFPPTPDAVLDATRDWRDDVDTIAAFFDQHLTPDPNSYIYTGDMIWMYNQFQVQHGNARISNVSFVRRFETHDRVTAYGITRARLKQGSRQPLVQSRPSGVLDPFSRLPGAPSGQVWCWTGVAFRPAGLDGSGPLTWGNAADEV